MAPAQQSTGADQSGVPAPSGDGHFDGIRVWIRNAGLASTLILLALYLMFAPGWAPKVTTFRYDNARCLQLVMLLATVCCLIWPTVARAVLEAWMSLKWQPRALISTLVFGGAVSTVVSGAPQLGALEVGLVTLLVFMTVSVFASVRAIGAKAERVLAFALVCGVGFVVLQFWVIQLLYLFEGKTFSWVSPFLEFANVRFFNQYQAYTLLLVTSLVFLAPLSGVSKMIIYLLAANFWALQWMVGGRAVWIGLAVASLTVLAFARRRSFKWLRTQLLLVVAGGLIFYIFLSVIPTMPGATAIPQKLSVMDRGSESVSARAIMARSAVELTYANPLLGVGPGQFGLYYSATPASHPHNSILQLLSEYGLIAGSAGIAVLGLLAVFAVQRLKADASSTVDPVNASLCASLVMGLIDSLFSGNLIMPHSQIALCGISGWLLGRNCKAVYKLTANPTFIRAEKIAFITAVLLSAAVVAILSTEYLSILRDMPRWLPERYPHFWQYGRFGAW